MLTELRVRDLAVIADVSLTFGPGLNVITGETGAGKSMLVDALALLLGERASGELVRPGADKARVEAAFEVPDLEAFAHAADEAGVDLDDRHFIARREISRTGRNRAWANGSPATVTVLAALGRHLVDLHGQHESQSLLRPGTQRDMLDAYAGLLDERERAERAFERLEHLRAEEAALGARRDDVRRRADYLRHVVEEIRSADPRPGEEESLATEVSRLAHAEELIRLAEACTRLLDAEEGSVRAVMAEASRTIDHLERIDESVGRWRTLLDEAAAAVDELVRETAAYAAGIEVDPARLAAVEERRTLLFDLMRKHGDSLAAVIEVGEEAARELDLLETAGFDLAAIAAQRADAEVEYREACAALSAGRRAAAGPLAEAVRALLPGLGLPDGRCMVEVADHPRPGASGGDAVTFHAQLNPGLAARPLAQVASGGELSRIMLALKVVLAAHDAVPTLVFDEVDQGIGGETGAGVAEALVQAARTRQVVVVTHLPQIAARAARHLVVRKGVDGGVASTEVQVIEGAGRVREIARMLGDPDDPVVRRHAEELLGGGVVEPAGGGRISAVRS